MTFQDSWLNISVSSLLILAAAVFEISCGQTDRQTHNAVENSTRATTVGEGNLTNRDENSTEVAGVTKLNWSSIKAGDGTKRDRKSRGLAVQLPYRVCIVCRRWLLMRSNLAALCCCHRRCADSFHDSVAASFDATRQGRIQDSQMRMLVGLSGVNLAGILGDASADSEGLMGARGEVWGE